MWAASSGPCTLDGACVQSANYPQAYNNNEACTIEIDAENAAPIVVEAFNVEWYFDYIVIDGWKYFSGRPCTLDGACAQSPNYPQYYSNSQACTIEINAANAAPIVVEYFNVQSYFDYLFVDGWKTF
ncbi:unnamed protein product, partial [Prorocentrum cordatum]